MIARTRFVEEWSKRVVAGSASLFLGAGVSVGAGYPSWRSLLKSIADELELDIEQEHDLAAVAQHYINRDRSRGRLTQMLAEQFPPKRPTSTLRLIARLPVHRIWTTNWDDLVEQALRELRREPDIKAETGDLTYERPAADVTLYKMH